MLPSEIQINSSYSESPIFYEQYRGRLMGTDSRSSPQHRQQRWEQLNSNNELKVQSLMACPVSVLIYYTCKRYMTSFKAVFIEEQEYVSQWSETVSYLSMPNFFFCCPSCNKNKYPRFWSCCGWYDRRQKRELSSHYLCLSICSVMMFQLLLTSEVAIPPTLVG